MTRNEVLLDAVEKCYTEMYKKSIPPANWKTLKKLAKEGKEDINHPFYTQHYLSYDEYKEIVESYIDAYNIQTNWAEHVDMIVDYITNGGYKPIKDMALKNSPLSDIIGKTNTDKCLNLINDCKEFYNNSSEEYSFRMTVMNCSPTSNKDMVAKYWKEQKGEIIDFDEK